MFIILYMSFITIFINITNNGKSVNINYCHTNAGTQVLRYLLLLVELKDLLLIKIILNFYSLSICHYEYTRSYLIEFFQIINFKTLHGKDNCLATLRTLKFPSTTYLCKQERGLFQKLFTEPYKLVFHKMYLLQLVVLIKD